MRGDNITVGSKSKASKSIVENPAEPTGLLDAHASPKVCGAMSQQRCDNGAQSTPQKFVRLVGCRDPKIKPQPKR